MEFIAFLLKSLDFLAFLLGTGKYAGGVLEKERSPLTDLVRMDVELGGEFRKSLVFAKRGQNDLGLESVIKGFDVLFFIFDSFFKLNLAFVFHLRNQIFLFQIFKPLYLTADTEEKS